LQLQATSKKKKADLKAYNIDNYKPKQQLEAAPDDNFENAADRTETDKLLNDIGMRALSGALTIADTGDYQQIIDQQQQTRSQVQLTPITLNTSITPTTPTHHHKQRQHKHHHHETSPQKKAVKAYKFPKGINVDPMAWLMDDGEVPPDL
jgi:hypothetical protein